MWFDTSVVYAELMRLKMSVKSVETYCTMKNSIDYCKITPRIKGEYRWPSLEALYKTCFDAPVEHQHNSYYDVINTAKCYFALNKNDEDSDSSVDICRMKRDNRSMCDDEEAIFYGWDG